MKVIMDDKEYKIVSVGKPDNSILMAIGDSLHAYNLQQAGDPYAKQLCYVVYGRDQEIMGGLFGETRWDWFHITLLWVKEELRGCGYGQRILVMAEDDARQHGSKHAYLDTFSFQAPDFYKAHGYQVFGALQEFPPGHTRYFFTKKL